MNNSQHSKVFSFEKTKTEGRINSKIFLNTFPHNFQLNKNLQIIYYFDGIESDDYIEIDSANHNNDDNLTNNNLNTKAEFTSIFREAKDGI